VSNERWAYYNDNDPFVCEWARNLVRAGLVPDGEVDCRSIKEVRPEDVRGFRQCHFFAGILGWSLALRLARWPDGEPVWTASCPCQPLSGAGKRSGHADERHLWPALFRLVAECHPATVFGEQVARADGREWLAGVRADLEAVDYACGAADLCAAGVGAPHIRQRLYWVAYPDAAGVGRPGEVQGAEGAVPRPQSGEGDGERLPGGRRAEGRPGLADAHGDGFEEGEASAKRSSGDVPGGSRTPWEDAGWVECADGRRRVKSGIFPMADGVPGRVARLRAIGNAIVPQVGAEFVTAYMEARGV
jgi:DNA (cytosine-5)-methyltransferase 1